MTKHPKSVTLSFMTNLLNALTDCRWKALDYLDAITDAIVTVRRGHRGN